MKDMDRIFRSKLYDHPSEMSGDLWSKIETGLKGEKKKRGFGWMWFGLLGFVILVGAGVAGTTLTSGDQGSMSTVVFKTALNTPNSLTTSLTDSLQTASNKKASSLKVEVELPFKSTVIASPLIEKEELGHSKPQKSNVNESEVLPGIEQASHGGKLTIIDKEETEISKEQLATVHTPSLKIITPSLSVLQRNLPDPIICPSFFSRGGPNIFIEGYYQPFLAFSMLSSNSAEIGDSYLERRRETESQLYSWSAGLNIGWISDYNVGVKAGVEYEVINERFTYLDPEAIRNQTVITIDTIFNNDGSTSVSMDTSTIQIQGEEIQKIHNYHRTLSIPVQAIYQMSFDQFALELSGGPVFNITYQNRGKIVDPSNQAQWFTNGESGSYNVYKNKVNISFTFSASVMYSISENIQLFARPRMRFHPTSMTRPSSPFSQKYLNTGLALGARYYFSGNPNY